MSILSRIKGMLSAGSVNSGAAESPLAGARVRNAAATYDRSLRRSVRDWPHADHGVVAAPRLTGCRSWVYQLQGINWERIEASVSDVAVVDISPDGSDAAAFPAGVVERMRTKPGGGDTAVLCYLSIGAAEPWRGYWNAKWGKARPGWMDVAPGAWRGSRRVHYWDERWQSLLFEQQGSRLHRILTAGFDGVVLDGIDSYEHYRSLGRNSATEEMIELVARIGAAAWRTNPNFMIVPMNGEELLGSARYRSVISAAICENVLYEAIEDGPVQPRSSEAVAQILDDLGPARADGIQVLAVEYLRDSASAGHAEDAVRRLRGMGLLPYIAGRRLDQLYPAS